MSERTAYVSEATTRRSRGSTRRRAPSRGRRRRCCARRGSVVRCECWISGPASAMWPSWWPTSSMPAARCSGSTRRSGCSRWPTAGGRRRRQRRVPPGGRAGVQSDRAVRRDRRAPAALSPARPRGGPAPPTRCAAPWRHHGRDRIRHRRHARGAGSPARRGGASLDRSGLPRGGGGSPHRRADRANAAPHGLCGCLDVGDPGLLRSERSDRAAPVREHHTLAGAADRGARASPTRRSSDSRRCRSGSPNRSSPVTR